MAACERHNATTLAKWPDALERRFETALVNEAEAAALATRLLTLFGPRADGSQRQGYAVAIEFTEASIAFEPGQVIRLLSAELGVDVLMMVVGVSPTKPARNQITLELFG